MYLYVEQSGPSSSSTNSFDISKQEGGDAIIVDGVSTLSGGR